jgi:hypothetical protein
MHLNVSNINNYFSVKNIIEKDLNFIKELGLIDYSLLLLKLDLNSYAQQNNISIN